MFVEFRLTRARKNAYLNNLLGDANDSSEYDDDSDDEDWLPKDTVDTVTVTDAATAREKSEGEGEKSNESEQSESEDSASGTSARGEEAGIENADECIAKDKTIWSKTPPEDHQTASHNVLRQRSGPCRSTDTLSVTVDTFKKIITVEMVDLIVRCTIKKAKTVYDNYNFNNPNSNRSWRPVTTKRCMRLLEF